MDSTDDEDHSNARWFYRRCSAARISMETPLSTLELSLRILRFVESIVVDVDGEEEEDCDLRASSSSSFQLRLFDELRDGCMARRRDLSFVYDVCDRALDLRDDGEFTEAALRSVAEAEEAARDGDGGCIGIESRDIGDDAVAAAAAAVASGADVEAIIVASGIVDPSDGEKITSDVAAAPSSAPSRSARGGGSSSARDDDDDDDDDEDDRRRGEQHVDIDGLRCFQLRTRVFGLSLPTFTTELWRYLQLAGWTHSHYTGKYHIPKRIKERRYDSEDMVKRMYEHFNLDDHARGRNGTEHPSGDGEGADDADGEGPESFDSSNELVDYLDEYCLPDYRSTMAEVEAARAALSAHSSAYRRRNLRLRLDLLEVVYRERLRKSLARREEESRSKYGHSHRPCEVCFRGANPVYPRVACRECGLVVHTNCYGLLDHAEEGGDGNGAEVDEKGYFTCDVCAIKCVFPRKIGRKQLYHASQGSGWRVHQHPDAACPLCGWNHITGGMVRIAVDDSDAAVPSDAKNRKRKSRRSEGPSESWVHLFCMNALPLKNKVSPDSVRSGGDATVHIRNLLDKSSEMVREVEVSFPPEKYLS